MSIAILRTPASVYRGANAISQLSSLPLLAGKHVFLVTGANALRENGTLASVTNVLDDIVGTVTTYHTTKGEPDVRSVDTAVAAAREANADVVVALGGGSVLDTGKAVAALIRNEGSVRDYLEGVGSGKTIDGNVLPFIAIPTTSGTGSEASKNAVVTVKDVQVKRSLRSDAMMASVVILDPTLTVSLPSRTTAFSGFDALGQLIESYTSVKATPYTDALCELGIRTVAASFASAYDTPKDVGAREGMQFAAYLSGYCLANSGLGAVHGFAAGLGGTYPHLSHGLIVGILLPHVMRFNIDHATEKLGRVGTLVTGRTYINAFEGAIQGIEWVEALKERMKIPADLSGLELDPQDVPAIVSRSMGNSMRGNPRATDKETLETFLHNCIE